MKGGIEKKKENRKWRRQVFVTIAHPDYTCEIYQTKKKKKKNKPIRYYSI